MLLWIIYNKKTSSCGGGLKVEQWTDNRTLSFSVGSNPARRQKDFRSNLITTGGALNIIICYAVTTKKILVAQYESTIKNCLRPKLVHPQ